MLTPEQNEFLCRTGPGTPMGNLFRRFWVPALLSDELPAPDCPPVRVRLLGEDLVGFRDSDGKVGLLDAHCPHRLADLFFGRNEECGLRCVYHGWKFDVNGECVDMPNEPAESNFKQKIRTTAYPCREASGFVWAYMGPKDASAEMPDIEWTFAPASHRFVGKVLVECNYLQALEGEIDNSHVAFLHSTLGDQPLSQGVSTFPGRQKFFQYYSLDKTPRGFVKDEDSGLVMAWRRTVDDQQFYWRISHVVLPAGTVLAAPPGVTQLSVLRTPRDDMTSWAFIVQWNPDRPLNEQELATFNDGRGFVPELVPGGFRTKANADNDYLIDRALQRSYSFTGIGGSIYNQDKAMTESMGPIVDRSREHLGTADVVTIAIRRKLAWLARDLQEGIAPYAAQHGDAYRVRSVDVLLPRGVPFNEGAKALLAAHPHSDPIPNQGA